MKHLLIDYAASFNGLTKLQQLHKQFLISYNLNKLDQLSLDEYLEFCYEMELGIYEPLGQCIKGGGPHKFGIYYDVEESCYKDYQNKQIDNEQIFYQEFISSMKSALIELENNPFDYEAKYPILFGSKPIVTKLYYLYYNKQVYFYYSGGYLKKLARLFEVKLINQPNTLMLADYLGKEIYLKYPFFKQYDPYIVTKFISDTYIYPGIKSLNE